VNPGDIVLIPLPQLAGGSSKLRPALFLASLPGPYQNVLVCGISTPLLHHQVNWDELIQTTDTDFTASGLHRDSVIRLSYLYAADPTEVVGVIGSIDPLRLQQLRQRLSDHLRP
jgi:mRNA interferase MazF